MTKKGTLTPQERIDLARREIERGSALIAKEYGRAELNALRGHLDQLEDRYGSAKR